MNNRFKTAFTLVELLVVIAIIGILSGLIIVGMNSSVQSATVARAQVFSASLRDSLLANLISVWSFDGTGVADGGTATTAYIQDSWGVNSSGTINGTPLVRSGANCIKGSCLDFIAVADYVNIGDNITLNLSSGYTLEAWMNNHTISGSKAIMIRRVNNDDGWFIFSYRNSGDSANYIYNYVEYTDTSNVTQATTPGAYLESNKWFHLVLSVDSSGIAKYYVNGDLKNTRNPTNFLRLGGLTAVNSARLRFGYWGSNGFDGLIDEARIYSSPIPASQIKERYFSGLINLYSIGSIDDNEYETRIGEINNNLAIK